MMDKLILTSLSRAISKYLSLDIESANRLKRIANKVITIELMPFHFIFQCQITYEGVSLTSGNNIPAETTIRGTPLQMAGAMLSRENRQRFFAEDLSIEGNAELGQQLIALFDELDIDWEEISSQFLGDALTHHISNTLRQMKNFADHSEQTLAQDMNEYIHEETRWFPDSAALEEYMHDIDQVRMDIDRIEARINRIKDEITP